MKKAPTSTMGAFAPTYRESKPGRGVHRGACMVRQMAAGCQPGGWSGSLSTMSEPTHFVFAILGSDDPGMKDAVSKAFKESDRYALPTGDWLVVAATQQSAKVYEDVKAAAGRDVRLIVVRMDRFYGWHDNAIWEWMEAKRSGE